MNLNDYYFDYATNSDKSGPLGIYSGTGTITLKHHALLIGYTQNLTIDGEPFNEELDPAVFGGINSHGTCIVPKGSKVYSSAASGSKTQLVYLRRIDGTD